MMEEIYKLYCRPYMCSFSHRYGPYSVVVVIKFLMPGYVPGKSMVKAVYADDSETYKYTLPTKNSEYGEYSYSLDYEMTNSSKELSGCYVLNIKMYLDWANAQLFSTNKKRFFVDSSEKNPGFVYFEYTQGTELVSGKAIKLNLNNPDEPAFRYGHYLYSTVYDQGLELRDSVFDTDATYRERLYARRGGIK